MAQDPRPRGSPAREGTHGDRIGDRSTSPLSSAESTRGRRPTVAEMHRMAEGRTVDQAVQRWLDDVDDGSVRAEIEQLRADNDLLGELAAVHREDVPAGSSMLEAPTPPGYEIIREIDRGAQGAVFLATQIAAKRQVALKVLLQGSFATDRQRMRFEREVEVVASLKHPNIVTLFDSGLTSDGSGLSRHGIRGWSPAERIRRCLRSGGIEPIGHPPEGRSVHPDMRCRQLCPSEGHHPSGSQARKHTRRQGRTAAHPRLRPGQGRRGVPDDRVTI